MDTSTVRIAGVVSESIVDGPGIRYVVFTQGCPHHCEGCHNEHTHDFSSGKQVPLTTILSEIKKNPLLSGVTLSGGEPFCQTESLALLAEEVHKLGKNVMAYSGYTFEELLKSDNPHTLKLLQQCDILVDGRFELKERDLMLKFRGSRNQRVLDVPKSLEAGEAIEKAV